MFFFMQQLNQIDSQPVERVLSQFFVLSVRVSSGELQCTEVFNSRLRSHQSTTLQQKKEALCGRCGGEGHIINVTGY